MRYILEQNEMDALVPKDRLESAKRGVASLREMIVGGKCVHDHPPYEPGAYSYCDECPLSDIGGRNGERRPDRETSRAMCDLPRRHSK